MDWEPIETAPFGPKGYCKLLVWLPVDDDGADGAVAILIHEDISDGSRYEWHDGSGDSVQNYTPTHWMPLPDPPIGQARIDVKMTRPVLEPSWPRSGATPTSHREGFLPSPQAAQNQRVRTRTVRVRAQAKGYAFGYVGEVVERDGRVRLSTNTYSVREQARDAAVRLLADFESKFGH